MKNNRSKGLIAAVLLLVMTFSFMLTSCGTPTNLEQYVKNDEELSKELEAYCPEGMSVDVADNTLTFTYKYEQEFTEDTIKVLKKELKNTLEMVSPTYVDVKDKLIEETGFEDITLVITYTDGKDTVIRSEEYK